jgi:iron complex outermembrane receptor protein
MTIAYALPAFAQDQDPVQEVVVTAQRRSELSRDVPISITSLSAETLEHTGTEQLGDIAKLTPGLRFDAAGSFFQPTIRGVGTAVTTSGGGPNVGIYTDGFFSSNPPQHHRRRDPGDDSGPQHEAGRRAQSQLRQLQCHEGAGLWNLRAE